MGISLRVLGLLVYDFLYPDILRVNRVKNMIERKENDTIKLHSRKRVFIDMSVISKNDAGTGIQRVVKEIAFLFIDDGKKYSMDIFFVSAFGKRPYSCINWPFTKDIKNNAFVPFEARPGDIFLGLDYSLDTVRRHRKQLEDFRKKGGEIWFLVHDILPIQSPQWFSKKMVARYRIWMDIIVSLSSGFFCNSDQTRDDLKKYIEKRYGIYERFHFPVIPMGFSFDVSSHGRNEKTIYDMSNKFILMVGTIEPRKGYGDIVEAFTDFLKYNSSYNLVIVGKEGWKVKETINSILSNQFYGEKIFWFNDVSDTELASFYENCKGLIMASYAEGFGLPLIEALSYKKPVLARDIPVFRPHEKNGVMFFPDTSDKSIIMKSISYWTNLIDKKMIKIEKPENNWKDAFLKIIETLS